MRTERRVHPREALSLTIRLGDGSQAVTRDVSACGMYFTMPADTEVEGWLHVELEVPGAGLKFSAAGEVVRVERSPDGNGVALRLHGPRLTSLR
ncbi:MAG: PilZ domain-containing protein [Ramlibacter sp.]